MDAKFNQPATGAAAEPGVFATYAEAEAALRAAGERIASGAIRNPDELSWEIRLYGAAYAFCSRRIAAIQDQMRAVHDPSM